VIVVLVSLYALAGALIGMLSGWLTALARRSRCRLMVDAVLGWAGFLLGLVVVLSVPWQNTISYELSGGTKVISTTSRYQHPWRVATVVAATLPLIFEIRRRRTIS
jgi:hypothetical protein